ncbi:MAG: S8 family serine peptidase [Candidatus Omnitrophica bacterium]|nr:S8 family serine peptidase [Candidatus Omnitrophota bacterium]
MRNKIVIILGVLAIAVGSIGAMPVPKAKASFQPAKKAALRAAYAPGRLIIKFREGLVQEVAPAASAVARKGVARTFSKRSNFKMPLSLEPAHKKFNFKGMRRVTAKLDPAKFKYRSSPKRRARNIPAGFEPMNNVYLMEFDPKADIAEAVKEYRRDSSVEYVQPDYRVKANWLPDDPFFKDHSLWGMEKISAPLAWDITKGEGVVIAVVDSGVDINHPDISANVWSNPNEIPGNNKDDDGNGLVDDVFGWNYEGWSSNTIDIYGHGTHVAGTICAVGNNATGVIGVAPLAKIMPVKSLADDGTGYVSDLAAGIVYAAEQGADVINNSWSCVGACPSDPVVEAAVRTAVGLGSVVVLAAGNDNGKDVKDYSPQNMPEVITVAASDVMDKTASFSNIGDLVSVSAPGTGTLSLQAGTMRYVSYQGTSMAAPHVSGVAALLLAKYPDLYPEVVKAIIEDTADPASVPGKGRLNAAQAVDPAKIAPVYLARYEMPDLAGNMDGRVQPGELVGVKVKLQAPAGEVRNVLLGLSSADPYVTLGVARAELPYVPAGKLVDNANALLTFIIAPNCPIDRKIQLTLTMTVGSFVKTKTLSVTVSRLFSRVSMDRSVKHSPRVSGRRIVWEDNRNNNADVYMLDLNTGEERQVTAGPQWQGAPDISGDRIVWQDGNDSNGSVFVYDIIKRETRKLSQNCINCGLPRIDGNRAVYTDWDQGGMYWNDLEKINGEQNIYTQGWIINLDISGEDIAWVGTPPYAGFVLLAFGMNIDVNGEISPAIGMAGGLNSFDSIVVDDGNSVWTKGYSSEIYWRGKASGWQTKTLTTESYEAMDMQKVALSGTAVVWQDERNGDWDIYISDLLKDKESAIVKLPGKQINPAISGSLVVWEDSGDGMSVDPVGEVYMSDMDPVIGSLSVESGAQYVKSSQVILTLAAASSQAITQMQLSADGTVWSPAEPYKNSKAWTLGDNGLKNVAARFMRADGKWSWPVFCSIMFDNVPPKGNISINTGAPITASRYVALNPQASDMGSGMGLGAQMQFSNERVFTTPWEDFSLFKQWTLPEGEGSKTVYARFKDAAGNISTVYEDTITVDTVRKITPVTRPTPVTRVMANTASPAPSASAVATPVTVPTVTRPATASVPVPAATGSTPGTRSPATTRPVRTP